MAADADAFTGLAIGYLDRGSYKDSVGNGTSQSAPLIAGLMAVHQQVHDGKALGFANPTLYAKPSTA
ncbi:hypothetical protein AB0H34_33090 [Saccharopolyspora shandongensis]|uniref:hypothetical protein n=1 Tax=Saccharopolyspora shandongensis TaxID=418495 RepID=UPI0033C0BB49